MKKFVTSLIGLILGITILHGLALAAPSQQDGQNLLQNPSFEGPYSPWNGISQVQVPAGWTPWWQEKSEDDPDWKNNRPEWKPAEGAIFPNRVHSGEKAIQWFWAYSTYNAGAYQQVNVPANAQVRFSGYAMGWSCEKFKDCPDATSYNPANMSIQIGIDPTGGTNPYSANIVWSPNYNYLDNWGYLEIEATAQGNVVTVFMHSNPDWPKQNQDTYFDDVSLVVVGGSSAPAAPAATAPPQQEVNVADAPATTNTQTSTLVTATPQPDGSIIHTVQAGETAWSIAALYDITMDELNAYNSIGAFIYEGQELIIQPASLESPVEEPTQEPTATPQVTENDEPEATEIEQSEETAPVEKAADNTNADSATLCVTSFEDVNGNGFLDTGETLLPKIVISVIKDQQILGTYITDGASEPYCFSGLTEGSYSIAQQVINDYTPTTQSAWGVTLKNGDIFSVAFGNARVQKEGVEQGGSQMESEAQLASIEKSTWANVRSALCTGGGIFGILLVIGAAIFMTLSRRK